MSDTHSEQIGMIDGWCFSAISCTIDRNSSNALPLAQISDETPGE